MHLAFIHARNPGSVDQTLNAVVSRLSGRGLCLLGVTQEPIHDGERHRCDMDLIEIANGARLSISQNLGAGSTGCRLDPCAVEAVAGRVMAAVDRARADLLVVNRFGKLEAMGRGFHPVIVAALERGVPVVVGVNDLNRPAFDAFAEGLAVELPDEAEPVLKWIFPLLQRQAA